MNKIRKYQYQNEIRTISHFDIYIEGTNFLKRARELSYPNFTVYELEQRAVELFNEKIKINALIYRTRSITGRGSQNQVAAISMYLYKHMDDIISDVQWLNSQEIRYPIPKVDKNIETVKGSHVIINPKF